MEYYSCWSPLNRPWSIDNFPNTLTACESVLQPENCKRPWDVVCNDNFINYSISTWFEEVNRINAKVGEGNNKLRTYALYIKINGDMKSISILLIIGINVYYILNSVLV